MIPTLDLLYSRCDEVGNCRLWKQACTAQGLPIISLSAKQRGMSVRRIVYKLTHERGVIAGRFVSPSCGNMKCISEHCLVQRTRSEYMIAAGRLGAYSSAATTARLTRVARSRSKLANGIESAREIRAMHAGGAPLSEIADEHGITVSAVWKIVKNMMWREVIVTNSVFNQRTT